VTPPFKPVVEPDEPTSNFDPEFTSADISHIRLVDDLTLDDDDPSEDWFRSQSLVVQHTPHGPLGSDRPPLSITPGIQIQQRRHGRDLALSPPLTSGAQENFRGFTYSRVSLHAWSIVSTRTRPRRRCDRRSNVPTTHDEALVASTRWSLFKAPRIPRRF